MLCTEPINGNNLLHIGAEYGHSDEVFEYIVKNCKVDINEKNTAGETVLMIANRKQSDSKVAIL